MRLSHRNEYRTIQALSYAQNLFLARCEARHPALEVTPG
uniref:Uncharacterized protein n=1 Tax=Pseudomonas putida (strain W619) TaxID=390235 RepID=B1J248_PSEPW